MHISSLPTYPLFIKTTDILFSTCNPLLCFFFPSDNTACLSSPCLVVHSIQVSRSAQVRFASGHIDQWCFFWFFRDRLHMSPVHGVFVGTASPDILCLCGPKESIFIFFFQTLLNSTTLVYQHRNCEMARTPISTNSQVLRQFTLQVVDR